MIYFIEKFLFGGGVDIDNNELNKFLMKNNCYDLQEITILKNKEFFISDLHIIVEGTFEVFISMKNKKHVKVATCSPKDFMIGSFEYFDKCFNHSNLDLHYKSSSDLVLKKVPNKILEEALKIPSINKWYFETMFGRLTDLTFQFFNRNTAKSDELIKLLLKKEGSTSNIVQINSVFDFVDKYDISRSTFYKGIKALEDNKQIKKEGKKITILEQVSSLHSSLFFLWTNLNLFEIYSEIELEIYTLMADIPILNFI